ncbi:MAG: transglutaminase domain-containing protein [Bacteroidia bacterium]|nr:transglutaminase domain-containing protein [Bacteroidia bacterium]
MDIKSIRKLPEQQRVLTLKHYLQSHVSCEGLDRKMKRPLLRASGIETLETGKGFCGEVVRLNIRLLSLAGIKSRRFYLFGKKWEHIINECKINGKWYLIDAFLDPETLMDDKQVAKIPSPEFQLLHNGHVENPFVDYHRIRFFHNNTVLNKLKGIKLPHFIIIFLESPHLIKSFIVLIILISFYLFRINYIYE